MQEQENYIHLRDGRQLYYTEYGKPDGIPIMLFHGAPGSHKYWQSLPQFPFDSKLRLIAPDRPGYGLSDFKRGQSHLEWVNDVIELANTLELEKFAVVGVSGGGPGTLACAWKIPERLTAVGIVSGMAPFNAQTVANISKTNRFFYRLARYTPMLLRLNMMIAAPLSRNNPDGIIERMKGKLSIADRDALERPEVRQTLIQNFKDAYINGGSGTAQDVINQATAWGFALEDISIPIHIWQPEDDTSTPLPMGQYMANTIPDAA